VKHVVDLFRTNGSSPPAALRRVLHLFSGEQPFTSIRVENPDDFEPLPPRFVLCRKAGAWWLRDTAARRVIVSERGR